MPGRNRSTAYNRYRAITISASLAQGYRLGEALDYLNGLVKADLPPEARVDYKGESKEFQDSSNAAMFSFGMALLVVFLVLAAQFESFIHPLVIILTVPLAVAGALAGLFLFDNSLNVYSQIGIVMLVGIAAKNGILIVEFANQLRDQGRNIQEALIEAASVRLRPILMTAVATMFGAIPLAMATGAGRHGAGQSRHRRVLRRALHDRAHAFRGAGVLQPSRRLHVVAEGRGARAGKGTAASACGVELVACVPCFSMLPANGSMTAA